MKSFIFTIFSFFVSQLTVHAQLAPTVPANLSDSLFSTYYQQRVTHLRTLPARLGSIIFLGNSITDGGEWNQPTFPLRRGFIEWKLSKRPLFCIGRDGSACLRE